MSGAVTLRVRGAGGSVVVKGTGGQVEPFVYRELGPLLRRHHIGLPELHWAAQEAGRWWLMLEDIPRPLPYSAGTVDARVVATLRRLHRLPLGPDRLPNGRFVPRWDDDMTKGALTLLPLGSRRDVVPLLAAMQRAAQPLFAPRVLISGDPNPLNWGLRDDGAAVLFDWERLTLATPALDLAIAVPGLGDWAAFRGVAAAYLADGGERADALAGEMAAAKVWSVVELLDGVAAGSVRRAFPVEQLTDALPSWLGDLTASSSLAGLGGTSV
jgi:aminoglycoside phosphotransferase (APT) family kinase protein